MDINFIFFSSSSKKFIFLKVFCNKVLFCVSLFRAKRPNILLPQRYILPSSFIRRVFLPPGLTEIIFFVFNEVIGVGI